MNGLKTRLLRGALETLYSSRLHRVLGPACAGVGAIFTLHHVRPAADCQLFAPNRILDITPQFLTQTIKLIRELGYDFLTLDQARQRILDGQVSNKFVCFTLDDGYIDNLTYAVPIFEEYGVPYTIYVQTGMPDGKAVLWWQHLEDVIRDHDAVQLAIGDREYRVECRTTKQKYQAFGSLYWALRSAPHGIQLSAIRDFLAGYKLSAAELCRQSALSWAQLADIAESELATIGAHTLNHYALSKLTQENLNKEIAQSRQVLAQRLNAVPVHFAYPYGDCTSAGPREFEAVKGLEFATATTTRKGVLFPAHKNHLHALPRVSLNGNYQKARYVPVFLSGVPFALMNRFRRLDVS